MAVTRESLYGSCYLGVCPLLKARLDARLGDRAPPGATLVAAGAAAGVLAAVLSQPFDTVKTRMQSYMGGGECATARSTARAVAAAGGGGASALFAGLAPRGLRIVCATIILQLVRTQALARIEGGG
jgi:hypothetical protein